MLKGKIILATVSLMLLMPVAQATAKGIKAKAIEKAHALASHNLKDPSSARFRNDAVYKKADGKTGKTVYVVCGEINAKNAYGAYVGFVPYYATDKAFIRNNVIADLFDQFQPKMCSGEEVKHGYFGYLGSDEKLATRDVTPVILSAPASPTIKDDPWPAYPEYASREFLSTSFSAA